LRGTTVLDSTWHGVSRRGASDACLPKSLARDDFLEFFFAVIMI